MLEYRGVRKRYGRQLALDGVDLDCPSGRTTVLIGPSGCGKSTLLRLAAGLIGADAGEVRIEGAPLSEQTLRSARLRMGYMIQEGGLFPHLSVFGNVELMARELAWSAARRRERFTELAELVRLPASLWERYPLELSGGQRQRAALMRALMLDPDLILLDEPLGALDPMIRVELQRELATIFAHLHKTVLMVTHDLAEAVFFGDRLVLMRAGRILQQGSAQALLQSPAEPFVADFVNAQRTPQRVLAEVAQGARPPSA